MIQGALLLRLVREQADAEAQQAVSSHLQQHTSQQDGTCRRRFHVRVRQPGVEREERDLHRERNEESEEQPLGGGGEACDLAALNRIADGDEVEAAGMRVEPDDRGQHEDRRDHGVQEELDRGVNAPAMPPDADDQRHRNQRGFPEEVEEEQVERDEDANHRRLENQHQDEELFHLSVHRLPRNQNAQRREESGQHHQPHGDAVDPEVVVNVGMRNPRARFARTGSHRARARNAREDAARPAA